MAKKENVINQPSITATECAIKAQLESMIESNSLSTEFRRTLQDLLTSSYWIAVSWDEWVELVDNYNSCNESALTYAPYELSLAQIADILIKHDAIHGAYDDSMAGYIQIVTDEHTYKYTFEYERDLPERWWDTLTLTQV